MRALLWLLRKYNYVLVFILLETIAIVILSNSSLYQRSIISNFHREISGKIYERVDGAREYFYLRKNNETLLRENTRLRNSLERMVSPQKLFPSSYDSLELAEADSLVIQLKKPDYFFSSARIVQSTHHKQFNYLTIDKGRSQGIERDMAVISEEGVVGIVLESSSNFATVIPIINRDFRLSAKIRKNNFVGILQWDGENHRIARLNEIPYHAELSEGDTIVTSGFSSIFPEGLYVGSISSFSMEEGNFYDIEVNLGTDFQSLFHVNVIENFNQKEQRALEQALQE